MTASRRMTLTAAGACVLVSTALFPLFSNSLWFAQSIGAVIVVAAAGALTRLRTLPVLLCLAASVISLLLYLNLVYEAGHSLLLVIPTTASLSRLWHLLGTGVTDANRYAPPAPNLPSLLVLAAGGVGIAAAMTDLIAVRLRSTALAGLPLLVLFTVPVMMNAPHSQLTTAVVFCLAGSGYLAMLSADGRERIRVWGRLVSLWRSGSLHGAVARHGQPRAPAAGPDTRALAAAGRRVGLASIVLALFAPLLIPGLHPSKLLSSGPGIGGTGGSGGPSALGLPGVLSQTIAGLRDKHSSVVLKYTTDASQSLQSQDPQYLQQYVFDTLTDSGWVSSDYTAGEMQITSIPLEPGLTNRLAIHVVNTDLHLSSGLTSSGSPATFLPVPFPSTSISAPPGVWLIDPDFMVFSAEGSSLAGKSYRVTSAAVDPTAAQLSLAPAPAANLSADLQLPVAYKLPALKQLAQSITSQDSTEYAKVNALATWLSSHGNYNVGAPGLKDAADLVTFLTKTRSGVCVQYAWAMTVLTRLLGIPARMASGFTSGTRQSRDHYVVTTKDDHAWPEVYFQDYGWIRFEPTPAGQGTSTTPNYMGGGPGTGSTGIGAPPVNPNTVPSQGPTSAANHLGGKDRPVSGGAARTLSAKSAGTPWAAVVLAVIAAIALASGVIAIGAPSAQRALSSRSPDARRRRRPVSATTVVLLTGAAALVALSLSRLLSRTSGLNLGAGWATVGIAFGAACALMLVAPAAGRAALRRWRWIRATDDLSRAHAAWREFRDDLADLGVGCRPSEPPRALADRVAAGLPEPARDAVHRIALAEERACYSARPTQSATLRRDGAVARRGFAASVRRGVRWRARIFPASLMTALADGAARLPDHVTALAPHRRSARALVTSCGHPPADGATALPSAPSAGPAWSAPVSQTGVSRACG